MKRIIAAVAVLAFASTCFAASGTVKWAPPKKFPGAVSDEVGVVKGPKGFKPSSTDILKKKEEAPAPAPAPAAK